MRRAAWAEARAWFEAAFRLYRPQNDDLGAARILTLTEQLNFALAWRYAARSEKISPDELVLFDEAEADAVSCDVDTIPEERNDDADSVEIAAHTRKKRGRNPLPDTLPRIEVVHGLPEGERICPHDGGQLKEIGESVCEQLDIVPAKIQVIRHIRKKYACDCDQCMKFGTRLRVVGRTCYPSRCGSWEATRIGRPANTAGGGISTSYGGFIGRGVAIESSRRHLIGIDGPYRIDVRMNRQTIPHRDRWMILTIHREDSNHVSRKSSRAFRRFFKEFRRCNPRGGRACHR